HPGPRRDLRVELCRSGPDAGRHLSDLPDRTGYPATGPVRKGRTMKRALALAGLAALALLAFVPSFAGPYPLGLMIGILGYGVLATAWAMFSGPTRYISLATVAFFGLGAYTVAVLADLLPYPLVLLAAAGVGLVVALVVGLATLRLAGIYF